jgi:outer membrane protein OmpA-like peptidoglycan-associated protein
MIRKLSVLCAAIALMATVPAHAQSKGEFQVGVGAGLPFYASDLNLNSNVGFGGRLGYMFTDKIGLEADAFYYSTEPSSLTYTGVTVTETPITGRLTYNAGMGKGLAAIFGLGYTYNMWGDDALAYFQNTAGKDTDGGPSGLFGLRFGAGGPVSLRVDLTGTYVTDPINDVTIPSGPTAQDSRFDLGMDAMLSLAFGGNKAPKDSDKDGVPDKTDLCPNTPIGTAVDANGCPFGDADKDGVTDNIDKCPNTPMGATVDAAGCPSDSDKDGVYNGIDQCPNTPMGATVDAKGCPADQDSDGVYNGLDKCPDTPPGAVVNASGCPIDSDGDGVADYLDKCPNTPAGMKVNAAGCPVLFEPGKSALVLEGVTFATNSAVLDPTSTGILDRLANAAQYNPSGSKLEIAGYTDNTGSRAHNMKLSQARAESVMNYLIAKGVPASMLTAKGYGPDFPIDTNATAAGRANNRRVMVKQTN